MLDGRRPTVAQLQPSTQRHKQQQQHDGAKHTGAVTVHRAVNIGTWLSVLFMLGATAREVALQTRYERRLRLASEPRAAQAQDMVNYLAETGMDDATVQCMRDCFPQMVSVVCFFHQ